jgi:hypothetical protein
MTDGGVCKRCGRSTYRGRLTADYFGPGAGHVLYLYVRLCSPEPRYSTPKGNVDMCDACRWAQYRPEPEAIQTVSPFPGSRA